MISNLRAFIFLINLSPFIQVFGQGNISIDTVTIVANRSSIFDHLKPAVSASKLTFAPLHMQDMLAKISSGVVQNSSPGGLSTFLHKGLPARHFPILWQDINILSSINGVSDLNLIPIHLFSEVDAYDFGSTTTMGTQSISGGMVLQQLGHTSPHLEFYSSLSTLQNMEVGANYRKTYQGFTHKISANYSYQNNIFSYKNGVENLERLPTKMALINVMYNARYLYKNKHGFYANIWINSGDRNIVPSIAATQVPQYQQDNNVRTNISYHHYGKKNTVKSSITYLREELNYQAQGVDSKAKANAIQWQNELFEKLNRNYDFLLRFRTDKSNANFFINQKSRMTTHLKATKRWKFKKNHALQATISQDVIDNSLQPLSGDIQFGFQNFGLKVARAYQMPTFNDLFWPQGGNPNLKPEISHQTETSYKWPSSWAKVSSTVYSNWVTDWILWSPSSNGIWSPKNQKSVWSRGISLDLSKQIPLNSTKKIELTIKPAYTKVTNTNDRFLSENIGKQLIYIPNFKSVESIYFLIAKFRIGLNHTFIGKRYETTDNSSSIKSYSLWEVQMDYVIKNNHWQANLSNLTNKKYEVISNFPMPGIQLSIFYKYTLQ
jgi:vitamin B12 transporter